MQVQLKCCCILKTIIAPKQRKDKRRTIDVVKDLMIRRINRVNKNGRKVFTKVSYEELQPRRKRERLQLLMADAIITSGYKETEEFEKNVVVFQDCMELLDSCKAGLMKMFKLTPASLSTEIRQTKLRSLNVTMAQRCSNKSYKEECMLLKELLPELKVASKYDLTKHIKNFITPFEFDSEKEDPEEELYTNNEQHKVHMASITMEDALEIYKTKIRKVYPSWKEEGESFWLEKPITRIQGKHVKSFVQDVDWFATFLAENFKGIRRVRHLTMS